MTSFRIRPSVPDDVPEIFAMVCELAEYEKARHEVQSTEALFAEALFCEDPAVWATILEHHPDDGAATDAPGWEIAGMAVWFRNFFTWTAKHSIYLDDLYVREQYRGLGYGKALLQHLAQICVERGYPRLDWWVLDWNPRRRVLQTDRRDLDGRLDRQPPHRSGARAPGPGAVRRHRRPRGGLTRTPPTTQWPRLGAESGARAPDTAPNLQDAGAPRSVG